MFQGTVKHYQSINAQKEDLPFKCRKGARCESPYKQIIVMSYNKFIILLAQNIKQFLLASAL